MDSNKIQMDLVAQEWSGYQLGKVGFVTVQTQKQVTRFALYREHTTRKLQTLIYFDGSHWIFLF